MGSTDYDRQANEIIDARGLHCPLPLIRLQQQIECMEAGQIVKLIADDRGVEDDLPVWSETTGHQILELKTDTQNDWVAYVEVTKNQ